MVLASLHLLSPYMIYEKRRAGTQRRVDFAARRAVTHFAPTRDELSDCDLFEGAIIAIKCAPAA